MQKLGIALILFICVPASSLANTIESFVIEQDGASCKAATPDSQGLTLDRNYQLGAEAGWVHCSIQQRAPYYTGFAWNELPVSELFLIYTLPTGTSVSTVGSIQSSAATRTSKNQLTFKARSPYGCSMDGHGPVDEWPAHEKTQLRFYNGAFGLPSHVLCYLPANAIIHGLTWSYHTVDNE